MSNFDVSPSSGRIIFEPLNMLRGFSALHGEHAHASDETFKIVVNGHALITNGVVDKKMKFHPTEIVCTSYYEESVYFWCLSAMKVEVHHHFDEIFEPKLTMNDFSDGMFVAASQVFPEDIKVQCYYHMVTNTKKNCGKHFKNPINKNNILEDLKSMQTIGFAAMNEVLFEKLKSKHPSDKSFFIQFEKSYWNGSRKYWLSSHLGAGYLRTKNYLEVQPSC